MVLEKRKNNSYENAIIVAASIIGREDSSLEDELDELALLSDTAGAKIKDRVVQRKIKINPSTFIGSGKVKSIINNAKELDVSVIIFNDELTPAQLKNIQKIAGDKLKIIDRTGLILDIFEKHAKTKEAKVQIRLARLKYLLPRLTKQWTHLERQKGGIGMRGPGETEIETDRRIVRDKISLLKEKIKSIDKQMHVQRGNRGKLIRVAIVGYTNVGKSTLMNLLSKSKVFAEDKLFATLDTTVRKIVIRNLPFLLSDTVGFIRKLPTQLIESFKSTLDEVREADLLLHVVDISHSNFEEHIGAVEKTLDEIKSMEKPFIMIFNKIDNYEPVNYDKDDLIVHRDKINFSIEEWKDTWMDKLGDKVKFISAKNNTNMEELKDCLYNEVRKIHITRFPYNDFLYPEIN